MLNVVETGPATEGNTGPQKRLVAKTMPATGQSQE